ncbi:MAG TPA: ABC transporter permease [Terriglobia bacterium]|nr:ABC transporter permease [Terriglobia bacterium]
MFRRRRRSHGDFAEELQAHLALEADRLREMGMSGEEALAVARRNVGNMTSIQERFYEAHRWMWLDRLRQDVRFGLRQLRRNPGFTAIAILTLALGIGANTAIFSMVHGILLSALPYPEAHRLYVVHEDVLWQGQWYPESVDNGGDFVMWRRNCRSFAGIAALKPVNDNLDLGNAAVQIHGTRASANLFSILGVGPMVGRSFLPEEDQPGRNREVILTYELWRAQFNSDPKIVGKAIRLNGYDYTVVGVLPSTFYFPKFDQLDGGAIAGWTSRIQYFVPLALQGPWETTPAVGDNMNFTVIARLKPRVTRQQALADLDAVEADISRHDPHADGAFLRGDLLPLKTAIVSATDKTLWMLMAGAGLVLLIVCVNLASLLLARSMGRTHEVAVRAALGATRWNLLRQFLTEGVPLVIAGGAMGVLLAMEGLRTIIHSAPVSIPRLDSIHVDSQVLLFSLAVSLAACLLFSLLPGLRLSRTQPADALKSAANTTTGARTAARLRDVLAGAEVSLCTVLLVAALLLVQSLARVLKENSWLAIQHALAVDLIAPPNEYGTQPKLKQLYDKLLRRVKSLPGVRAAGFSSALPLRGEMWGNSVDFQESPLPAQKQVNANFRFVSPEYFKAIGLPLVRGRFFTQSDEGQDEVVISEAVAREALPGRNPIGMHLRWHIPYTAKPLFCRVTGVVADARAEADQQAPPVVYFPYWVWGTNEISLVVRTTADPGSAATDVREAIRRLDSQIAVPREETLQDVVSEAVAPRRFVVSLAILFAGFATFLAALGLYGVIALSVAQRTQEIGIRMALGARRRDVLRMVLVKGLKLSLAGIGIGLACAIPLTRLITSLLYGVRSTDPVTLATVCILLAGMAVFASYIPARRATRVDPLVALRYE